MLPLDDAPVAPGHSAGSATLTNAIPTASHPKLRTQLLLAHTVVTATNAGNVYVQQNPLAINWPQYLALFRHLIPQLHWVLMGAEQERAKHVNTRIEQGWQLLQADSAALWQRLSSVALS